VGIAKDDEGEGAVAESPKEEELSKSEEGEESTERSADEGEETL
jgi:hypothetical protein